MDPYDEQRLKNEVIFLHSLWHQGPPTSQNPNPIPPSDNVSVPYIPQPRATFLHSSSLHHPHQYCVNPNPRPTFPAVHNHSRALRPINPCMFNKRNKKRKRKRKELSASQPVPALNSGSEWPCPMPTEDSTSLGSEWPPLETQSASAARPLLSVEERERLAALQAQYRAFQSCRDFLLKGAGSDDEGDDRVGNEDDDDEEEDEGDNKSEEYVELFVKLFMEDGELRSYYQKNYEGGEFCCLVCGAIGKKYSGKKFKDCVSLVQHSTTISKTKKKWAHRAFGQALCKLLGWDINRLPSIVIIGEPLGCSMPMKVAESEGEPEENADDIKDVSNSNVLNVKVVSLERSDELVEQDGQEDHQTTNQASESFLKDDCLDNNTENHEKSSYVISEKGEGKDDVTQGSPESLISGVEWVYKSQHNGWSSTASGWRAFNRPALDACPASAEDQATSAALCLQHKALEACQEFLVGNVGSDSDEDGIDDEDEDELMYDSDSEECDEFKFFIRLFKEDSDLRRYYENNYKQGYFYCLVCGGIGKKVWKRFKDCSALLQHSTAILRTKRKQAHRAYAHVICKVLGWDFDRLPAIVLKGETLGSSPASSGKLCDEPEKPANGDIDDAVGEPEKSVEGFVDNSDVLQGCTGKLDCNSGVVSGEPPDSSL